jgi:hypothetical protein
MITRSASLRTSSIFSKQRTRPRPTHEPRAGPNALQGAFIAATDFRAAGDKGAPAAKE